MKFDINFHHIFFNLTISQDTEDFRMVTNLTNSTRYEQDITGEMAVTASTLRYSNNSYLSILIEYLKVDAVSDHYCQKQ